jgi:hypothetical protein
MLNGEYTPNFYGASCYLKDDEENDKFTINIVMKLMS